MRNVLSSVRAGLVVAISVAIAGAIAGCEDPGAALEITGARAARTPDKRVTVEIDLVASEGLGKNIGIYCTRVTFAGQEKPAEECKADLEDGDTKTVRLVSEKDLPDGAAIAVRVRLGNVDIGRSLAAPRH
jgi:hypothetical protein